MYLQLSSLGHLQVEKIEDGDGVVVVLVTVEGGWCGGGSEMGGIECNCYFLSRLDSCIRPSVSANHSALSAFL